MFLCQPLVEVLAGRGIEDIDAFLKVPSWNDLPDPFFIPSMEKAVARVLCAVRQRERITIHGDYDCDGVLGTHIVRGVLTGLGATPRTYLPHRDEGYGLSSATVHRFSCSGTDLLITVDNGINAQSSVRLAKRLGIDVVVIDHHRIQEQAETTAVWSDAFYGAGLAAMFAWALELKTRWNDTRIERLLSCCSPYAAIASIADCVPLLNGTRTFARLGLAELSANAAQRTPRVAHQAACTDPSQPDSRDVAFGIAPRINAAGRMAHPAEALAVFEAALDEEAARQSVGRLNQLNLERRRTVKLHFEELVVPGRGKYSGRLSGLSRDESEGSSRHFGEQVCREVSGSQHRARPIDNARSSSWIRKKHAGNRPSRASATVFRPLCPVRRTCASSWSNHGARTHSPVSRRLRWILCAWE